MSIVIGGIWHETNTFSPLATDHECFERFQLVEGEAILDVFAGTNSEIGGMIEAAREPRRPSRTEHLWRRPTLG